MGQNFGYCIGLDIVGFSKKSVSTQTALFSKLNEVLKGINNINAKSIINTGDGAFIIFSKSSNNNVKTVLETAIKVHNGCFKSKISIRMGIGAGAIISQKRANFIGDGINLTARIMDCGNEGHILLSQLIAFKSEVPNAIPRGYKIVHMGEYQVKHSLVLDVYALVNKDQNANLTRDIPVKNRINWEALHTDSSKIIFPKMEDLKVLETIHPKDLEDLTKWTRDGEFVVANAEIHLRREGGVVSADVWIDDYPFVATTKENREKLEIDKVSDRHGMSVLIEGFKRGRLDSVKFNGRFSAGGAIGMITCADKDYIFVFQRDKDAPVYPNSLCPASGLSENLEEWLHPDYIAYREFFEETLITIGKNNERKILNPVFDDDETIKKITSKELDKTIKKFSEFAKLEIINASAKFLPLGQDVMYITWGNRKSGPIKGNLVIDSEIGVIDIIGAIQITLNDCSIENIRIFDAETKNGNLIHSRVLLFEKNEFFKLAIPGEKARYIASWKEGKKGNGMELPETPKIVPPLLDSIIPLAKVLGIDSKTINKMRYIQNNERSFLPE